MVSLVIMSAAGTFRSRTGRWPNRIEELKQESAWIKENPDIAVYDSIAFIDEADGSLTVNLRKGDEISKLKIKAIKHEAPDPSIKDRLNADMSDEQILRVLQLDPSKLEVRRFSDEDCSTTFYLDDRNEVRIIRCRDSSVAVRRVRPLEQSATWELKGQKNR